MSIYSKRTLRIKLLIYVTLGLLIIAGIFFIKPSVTHAAGLWDNLQTPLETGKFEMENMQQLVLNIIDLALILVTWITMIFMIVGGYLYIASGGNPDLLERAKKTITGAIIAFILIIMSKAIVAFIESGLSKYQTTLSTDLVGALRDVINLMLFPVGLIGVLGLIAGGYQYMTAAGNPDQIGKAKKTILYSIIGLIAIIISWAVIYFIARFLNVSQYIRR